jgi:DHA1 family bicyclomycin/chloramphenicol resistance-like MFS transporter
MYLAAMPTLKHHFATSTDMVQLTLASFFIGFSLGQAFYGPFSDKYGRKAPLYVGLSIFVIASIGCAFASSVSWLIFFRFLQALGACSGGVMARAIVRDIFHPKDASKIYSYLMLVMGLAPILAPMAGGYVLMYLGWEAIFLILASMGAISLVAVIFGLKESGEIRLEKTISFRGTLLEYWIIAQNRHFLGFALLGGFCMAALFAYITSSPFVFMDIFGLSIEQHGILFGANALAFIVSAQINARVVNKLSTKILIIIPAFLLACFGLAIFLNATLDIGGIWGIAVPMICFMLCIGFIVPNATALAMAPFSTNAGSASALLGVIQFSMAAISSISLGLMHNNALISMGSAIAFCGVCAFGVCITILKK